MIERGVNGGRRRSGILGRLFHRWSFLLLSYELWLTLRSQNRFRNLSQLPTSMQEDYGAFASHFVANFAPEILNTYLTQVQRSTLRSWLGVAFEEMPIPRVYLFLRMVSSSSFLSFLLNAELTFCEIASNLNQHGTSSNQASKHSSRASSFPNSRSTQRSKHSGNLTPSITSVFLLVRPLPSPPCYKFNSTQNDILDEYENFATPVSAATSFLFSLASNRTKTTFMPVLGFINTVLRSYVPRPLSLVF
jgi:hypothetical protein